MGHFEPSSAPAAYGQSAPSLADQSQVISAADQLPIPHISRPINTGPKVGQFKKFLVGEELGYGGLDSLCSVSNPAPQGWQPMLTP